MTKRTKLRMEKAQLYMTKNVFNGRFVVRNILVATAAVTAVAIGVGTSFFIKESKASKKAEAEAYAKQEIVLTVPESPVLDTEGFTVLAAGLDNKTDIKANDAQMVASAESAFAGKAAAADDGILIRSSASLDAPVIGMMDKGAVADVKTKTGEWIKISSGDITGYVVESQMAYGKEGYELAEAAFQVLGVISEDDVCVRVAASMDSDQVEMADRNDKYEVDKTNTDKDWVCVTTLTTGGIGYIRAQFVRVTEGYLTAYATDDGQAVKPVATGDIEQIGTVTAEVTEDDTEASTEEPKPAETTPKPASNVQPPVITQSGSVALSDADINLMAAIMTMECGGESYEGQLAVANVILNRLRSGAYGSTIADVVYAPGQFEVAGSSALEGYIACPQASCVQAAREAASGVNNIGGMMSFGPTWALDASSFGTCIQIGNHIFY